jgi:hypothetical protein
MLTSAVKNTQGQLITLIKGDFTGKNNFIYWMAAMLVLGGLGYIPAIKTPSRYLMALVLIVLVLKNKGGVFAQFVSALNGANPANALSGTSGASGSSSSSSLLSILGGTGSGNNSGATIQTGASISGANYGSSSNGSDDAYLDAIENPTNLQTQETSLDDVTI